MSAISLKSITGITSITTPSGVDNVFTVHTNDTTERFRVDSTGSLNIAGISTFSEGIFIPDDKKLSIGNASGNNGDLQLFHTNNNSYVRDFGTGSLLIQGSGVYIQNSTGGTNIASFLANTGVSIPLDLDVDGHTNLDNVSVAGVTTFAGAITAPDMITAGALLHEGDTDTLVHFSAANTIQLKTGGTSRLAVTNSGVALENGYLNSNGNRIILGDSSGATDDRIVLGNTNDLQLYHNASDSYIENATGVLKILGDDIQLGEGNDTVGIGTDNAGAKLDVLGSFQVKDTAGLQNFYISDSGFKFNQTVSNWSNMTYTSSPVLGWDYKSGPGDMFYVGSGGNSAMASQMALVVSDGHGVKIGKSGYDGTDYDISSTDEYLRITSAGSVGINSTSPDRRFTIHQDATCRMNLKSLANSTAGIEFGDDDDHNAGYVVYDNSNNSFQVGLNGTGEKLRITSDGEILLPGNQTQSDQTGKLDIYHTSPAEIDSPHIRLWGPTNQDARIEFGSETNSGEGAFISYNDSDEGLWIGSRMATYSEVNICTGMNDGSPHSNARLTVNAVGRSSHMNTTEFNREAYTKGGTVHGGGAATGANNVNPGAYTFVNATPVRGSNTRYSFWVQSSDAYPNASNYLDFTVANAAMYRVLVKGSNSSATADIAQFLIYGLANSSGNLPPVIEQLDTTPPSFNGDNGGGSPDFHINSGSFSCIVMGYGTSGGTRGSTGTYDTTLRIQYSGGNNQGLVAFIERWDSGT